MASCRASAGRDELNFWRNEQRRYEHPLAEGSLVVDVGGNVGHDAAELIARYSPRVVIYEPFAEMAAHLRDRFARNPKVTVRNVGLLNVSADLLGFLTGRTRPI
jgi:16S rRNA A1518/A1519 N6-dimethyltransferase RsmA/KsgA/DIM1 with predicted DNA glycosylase/AP lyase activity